MINFDLVDIFHPIFNSCARRVKSEAERGILTTYWPPETHDACGRRPPTGAKWVWPLLWSVLSALLFAQQVTTPPLKMRKDYLTDSGLNCLLFPRGNFFLGGDGLKRILWQILEFLVAG